MTSDGELRLRVVRKGPYTKANRKQLAHHVAVGAGLGGSAGATVGAHYGAHLHAKDVAEAREGRWGAGALARHSRGKVALVGAGIAGAIGATYGASGGSAVASMKRHRRALAKADHDREKEGAAAAAGAGAAGTAYQAGGFKMKLAAQRQGSKAPAGISRSKYEKTIKEHQRAHGAYHGGAPEWLGRRGRVGHTVGLVTGQGPTAHVNAARHWPTKIEGVSVPGARIRRVMGYTHGGKTGLATGAAVAAVGAGSALGAAHHELHKAEPLAIAGKLWRKPTVRSEFRRAFDGTRKGEHMVGEASRTPKTVPKHNQWGYPAGHRVVGDHGSDVKAALHAQTRTEAAHSPHRTGFNAGVRAGKTVAVAGRHPEYAISVPAAGGGVGLAHHEIKRSKQKKGTTVAKSAFGVEDVRLEKGMLTSGLEAIKGFKGGLGGVIGAAQTGAGAAGKVAGAATMGKLKPIGVALTKTPARLATTSALGGLGVGMAAGDGKKNN